MAAATTDTMMKVSRKWVGQIGSAGVADAVVTTIPLLSATNLPSTTLITLVVDRVDSSGTKTPTLEETFTGIVSGNNIVSVVRGVEGTAQAHTAGAVVEMLFTASQHNALMDGLLVEHSQKGNHTDVCATTLTSTGATTVTTTLGVTGLTTASDINASAVTANSMVVSQATTLSDVTACAITADSMVINTQAYFDGEVDNGNSGVSDTIDWTVGNKQKSTITSDVGYTFTAPTGPCNLTLKCIQGPDGTRLASFPAAAKWPSGTAPTLSTASDSVDILVWYFDGTNYYGTSSTDFS